MIYCFLLTMKPEGTHYIPNAQTGQLQTISPNGSCSNCPYFYHIWSLQPELVQATKPLNRANKQRLPQDLRVHFGSCSFSSKVPAVELITLASDSMYTHTTTLLVTGCRYMTHLKPKTIHSANVFIIIGTPVGEKQSFRKDPSVI